MICYQIDGVGTAETNSYRTLSYKFFLHLDYRSLLDLMELCELRRSHFCAWDHLSSHFEVHMNSIMCRYNTYCIV